MATIRAKPENYVPDFVKQQRKVRERAPHEQLTKPKIRTVAGRTPLPRKLREKLLELHTLEEIRLGRAPPELAKTVGPGPWDYDPSFWQSPFDPQQTWDWEIEEDDEP